MEKEIIKRLIAGATNITERCLNMFIYSQYLFFLFSFPKIYPTHRHNKMEGYRV